MGSSCRGVSVLRNRVRVEGTVQGVGFRPYVYRLARELELAGYVLNDERGVLVEIEGSPGAVERFCSRLPAEAPPLARVESVACVELPAPAPGGERPVRRPPRARTRRLLDGAEPVGAPPRRTRSRRLRYLRRLS